ncbi:MAG TPA: c-type cytochrome, partial [Deltaproteobacteria bacterium]|nr:c-type cytochrome [Deltaproteobacteria bacterium]
APDEPAPDEPAPDEPAPDEPAPQAPAPEAAPPAPAAAIWPPQPEIDPERGWSLYRQRCALCHGVRGDGRGPAARFMRPPPRDLTEGMYRFRSVPVGVPATEVDLYRTISRGLIGTAMPGFGGLPSDDLWQLVYYVRSLSPRYDGVVDPPPLEIGDPPPATPARVARGAEVYARFGCASCHGPQGRGDGPAAGGLVDTNKRPLAVADLTRRARIKGGASPVELYRTLSTGLEGTPMPSYGQLLPETDRWALVHYVRSLSDH